jgi:hypothetical protein
MGENALNRPETSGYGTVICQVVSPVDARADKCR